MNVAYNMHLLKNKRLWGAVFTKDPDKTILNFLNGRDVINLSPADELLLQYDLHASIAHVKMLAKQCLISKKDEVKLINGLQEIKKLHKQNKFKLDPSKEDVHTNIEAFLIDKYGIEIGGKIHTGRSRNDQILVATRLLLRDVVNKHTDNLIKLNKTITAIANKHDKTIMPGYTHHQKAMPTTFKQVMLSFVAMFERDLTKSKSWLKVWNKNPLGAVAGYGTSLPIDRKYTAKLLGFDGVESSTIDSVTSRWEAEADYVYLMTSFMNHVSIFAQTFLLFCTEEFGFIKLSDSCCTGSSIMPQKKNPDVLEVLKAKAGWILGQLVSVLSIGKGNFIGYNKDTQWTKYIIIDVIRECGDITQVIEIVLDGLTTNIKKMKQATTSGNLYATHFVEKQVKTKKISLRQAKINTETLIKQGSSFNSPN